MSIEGRQFEVELLLTNWARWKQTCLIGLSFASRTLEHRLMSGEILGPGHDGGPDPKNMGVRFREDPTSQVVDGIILRMDETYRRGTLVLKLSYIMGWSVRKIAVELNLSRRETSEQLERARRIFRVHYELFLVDEPCRIVRSDP